MTTPAAPTIIELAEDQSAEPGKCGSCQFFKRYADGIGGGVGWCNFRLPPQVTMKGWQNEQDEDFRPSGTNDTSSCSLYRPANFQWTKKIHWTVPQG